MGSGANGVTGVRSASSGSIGESGIAAPLVEAAEFATSAHEQGFGGGDAATKSKGRLGDAESVQVTKSQRSAMLRRDASEYLTGPPTVQLDVPRVVDRRGGPLHRPEQALLAGLTTPVIHQLVSCHPDQPADTEGRIPG